MMFKKYLVPDFVFNSIYEITPSFLSEKGIKNIICDIDNTLSPYEEYEPSESVSAWINGMKKSGMKIALVSNNRRERVNEYNKNLNLHVKWKAGKPSKRAVLEAMFFIGGKPENTVLIGDQMLTDVCAGKRCGLMSVFVYPIKDKTHPIQRIKRMIEKRYMKLYQKGKKK